jgi:hypothetical protein
VSLRVNVRTTSRYASCSFAESRSVVKKPCNARQGTL